MLVSRHYDSSIQPTRNHVLPCGFNDAAFFPALRAAVEPRAEKKKPPAGSAPGEAAGSPPSERRPHTNALSTTVAVRQELVAARTQLGQELVEVAGEPIEVGRQQAARGTDLRSDGTASRHALQRPFDSVLAGIGAKPVAASHPVDQRVHPRGQPM